MSVYISSQLSLFDDVIMASLCCHLSALALTYQKVKDILGVSALVMTINKLFHAEIDIVVCRNHV